MDLINLLRDWGWLFGIIWLGFLVVRESSRPGAAERERALANVRMAALDAIRKFEKLSMAYEVNLPRANRDLVEIARMDVMYSFGNLIRAAIAVDPERRWEYEALLYRIKLDHGQTYDLPRSTFASTTSPLTAIDVALKKYPPPEPSKES